MSEQQYRPSSRVERLVEQHDQDLYRGNGKPGITTRLAILEDCMDKISRNLRTIVFMLITIILGGLGKIIFDGVKH